MVGWKVMTEQLAIWMTHDREAYMESLPSDWFDFRRLFWGLSKIQHVDH